MEEPFDLPKEPVAKETLLNWIDDERSFLHAISSPITVALGMTDSAQLKMKKEDYEAVADKLEKTKIAVAKLTELLLQRRRQLVVRGETLTA